MMTVGTLSGLSQATTQQARPAASKGAQQAKSLKRPQLIKEKIRSEGATPKASHVQKLQARALSKGGAERASQAFPLQLQQRAQRAPPVATSEMAMQAKSNPSCLPLGRCSTTHRLQLDAVAPS